MFVRPTRDPRESSWIEMKNDFNFEAKLGLLCPLLHLISIYEYTSTRSIQNKQTYPSLNHRIGLDKVHYDQLNKNYYRCYDSATVAASLGEKDSKTLCRNLS